MRRPIVLILLLSLLFISGAGADSLAFGGPYGIGDQISIRGDTNYNTDNKVLVEVFPASFGPTAKYESSMNGGGSEVVPVIQNEQGGFEWSAAMSSAGWDADRYMIRVEVIGKDFRETALFDLRDNSQTDTPDKENSVDNLSNSSTVTVAGLVQTPTPDDQIREEKDQENFTPDETVAGVPAQQTNKSPLSPVIILLSGMGAVAILAGKKRN